MLIAQTNNTVTVSGIGASAVVAVADTRSANSVSYILEPTDTTGSSEVFSYAGTGNVLTVTADPYALGQVVTLTAGTGQTLPTGLGTGTNYYAIPLTGTSVELASTLAHAQAGTAVALSGTSTNVGTIVPTAISTVTAQVQVMNGTGAWVNNGTAITVTAGTNLIIEDTSPAFASEQIVVALASGQLSVKVSTCLKITQ